MKLPELPTRMPKAPTSGGGVKAPAFLTDLFKDMRDRRLIIPAVALLVAIFAVPVLLSSSPAPSVVPPPPATDPAAAAVEPGVLAVEELGVRDFHKRLDAMDRKNPFGDRFEPKATEATAGELVEPSPVDTGAAADVGGGGATPVADGGTISGTDASAPTVAPSSDPGSNTGTSAPVEAREQFVLVPRVDVKVGIVDRERRKSLDEVKPGDLLPSKQAPVAMYLGNSDDSENAEFLVSRDVERVNGEGDCRPQNDCEFLKLADGSSAYLRFADGNRYVITVTDIYFERIPEDELKEDR